MGDVEVNVAVLNQRVEALERRLAEAEDRLAKRVTAQETNMRWGVLLVLSMVISAIMSKLGFGAK